MLLLLLLTTKGSGSGVVVVVVLDGVNGGGRGAFVSAGEVEGVEPLRNRLSFI